ncbi:A-factor biosynthesis protein [Streptomyces sp. NBC_01754]|uniref:ScbA/BarX family gamma-butyrolactone biosynthesis protein n=1 Tax=Streptomyces sp. NBC_01754 TaxID=2975930 RepID=UPI002DDB76E5|nr:ScbA/BarX family gamma-butyrolactone biosynthesis protein [Streptomyces sp. NBC_01754]WSC93427.1 A-factor biosynthesis protein [Streptomyces sp. NBC_01754]
MSGGTVPDVPVFPPAPAADLEGVHAVPKAYLHLRRDASVFVTGWRRLKDGEFSLTVRWPTPDEGSPYDPRVLTQTIRQSGLVVAHAAYGVPLSHQTLLHHFDFTVIPGFRPGPAERRCLTVEITVSGARKPGRTVSSLGMDVRLLQGTTLVARADSEFGWISPRAYARVRGDRIGAEWNDWPLLPPVAPRTVARATGTDVVLAPGEGPRHWQLRHDADNTLLYDHPVDHVPGLVLMEAAYQAAHATVHPLPFEATTVAARFERYVEFDRPCWIEAEPAHATGPGQASVAVTGVQDGLPVFRGRMSGPCG